MLPDYSQFQLRADLSTLREAFQNALIHGCPTTSHILQQCIPTYCYILACMLMVETPSRRSNIIPELTTQDPIPPYLSTASSAGPRTTANCNQECRSQGKLAAITHTQNPTKGTIPMAESSWTKPTARHNPQRIRDQESSYTALAKPRGPGLSLNEKSGSMGGVCRGLRWGCSGAPGPPSDLPLHCNLLFPIHSIQTQ